MASLRILALVAQGVVVFYSAYILFFALAGLFKRGQRNSPSGSTPRKRFAILVPARNEESSIGQLLTSLQLLHYPSDCYDVYVVADNCTDNTAEVARGLGATAFERFNDVQMTKGYALEFLLDRVLECGKAYEGFVVFDADNIVAPSFLDEINKAFASGCHVVQGQWLAKNPRENWITRLNYTSALFGSLEQQGRFNLGLSCGLSGTAMAFPPHAIQRLGGWQAYGLLDDREMQANCVSNGLRIVWWPEAIAYDETTSSMHQASNQRVRWLRGAVQVLLGYFDRLLVNGVKTLDFHKIEHYLWISRSLFPRSFLMFLILGFMFAALLEPSETIFLPWQLWLSMIGGYMLLSLLGLGTHRADWRMYLALLFAPAFTALWLWAMTRNVFVRRLSWHKTAHTSTATADDVLTKR